jgi:Glycine-rich domain
VPLQVTPWATNNPVTAKSLNLALYTCDGTQDTPNGIQAQAQRPVFLENYTFSAGTVSSSTGGTRTSLTGSGSVGSCQVVMDTAGYYGQSSDLPGTGYYRYTPVIKGSSGDGVSAGGWVIIAHFAAVTTQTTQTSVGADLLENGTFSRAGTRFPASTTHDSTPFYLDLRNTGTNTWEPAVLVADSSSTPTSMHVNATDASGEATKLYAVWAGVSAGVTDSASYTAAGSYNFTAPAGVTSVSAAPTGAGGGSGAGQGPYAGGGGGGGEWAQNASVSVTAGHDYTVTVGAGGAGGTEPGGAGTAGGVSSFAGDTQTVTAHGGAGGAGATVSADGAGGAGGTGSTAPSHHDGGAGAAGQTGTGGGGGGSSASAAGAGNTASGTAGALAPSDGGNGGAGGSDTISVVQYAVDEGFQENVYTVRFGSPLQAGNAVIVAVAAMGTNSGVVSGGEITSVVLDDGTQLASQVSTQVNGSPVPCTANIWDVADVAGGEQVVTVSFRGPTDQISFAYCYEVAGLGPTLQVDASTSADGRASSYTSGSVNTTGAPDFWIGLDAWQGTSPATIYAAGSPWAVQAQQSDGYGSGGANMAMRPGYAIVSAPGTMQYSGALSESTGYGAVAVAYTTSAPTPGDTPASGPGGGAGGGLGAYNGAAGSGGAVTLSWTSAAGSPYGTPGLPAPIPTWTPQSQVTSAILNGSTGIAGPCNFLANPPMFSVTTQSAQSIASATATALTVFAAAEIDNYSGWDSAASTYTVQRDGLYLMHGLVAFATSGTGERLAGADINGTIYWGPGYTASSADKVLCSKTQIFGLHAGDTVQLACWQNSGGSLSTETTDYTRFFLAWLGAIGAPAQTWAPPDPGFRWQSGTSGELAGGDLAQLFQEHLASDLGFLVSRPYLLAYQSTAQAGLSASAFHTVTLDTVGSPVHPSDTGDNYAGWVAGASNKYTAQAAGWYLMCGEYFTSAPSSGSVIGAVDCAASGGVAPSAAPDWFGHMPASTSSSAQPGATVFGLAYLSAGESITPQVQGQSYGSPFSTATGSQSGGQVASHFGCVWISE